MINVTRAMGGVYVVSMSSKTENAVIRYTTDGNEPGETSPVYTEPLELAPGVTVKARAYEDVYHEPSDSESVELPEPVAMEISIGTVIGDDIVFYDRGAEYGDYFILTNELIRISTGIDDESIDSSNWRFLLFNKNYKDTLSSYTTEDVETYTEIGTGLYNTQFTSSMSAKNDLEDIRTSTGKKYFIGSGQEVRQFVLNKDSYTTYYNSIVALSGYTDLATSSMNDDNTLPYIVRANRSGISSAIYESSGLNKSNKCVMIRRI